MPPLGDATVFAIPADGGEPERLARAWLTDIQQAEAGNEVRAALRSVPVRRYEMTAKFGSAAEGMQFRALWHGAFAGAQQLRFVVPISMRGTNPSAFPDASTITTDTRYRGFVAGGRALVAQFDEQNNIAASELVTIDTVTDDGVTLVDAVAGDYTVGAASLLPVMNAWLDPPVVEQFGVTTERVPLIFREELPGVAGIDPDVGVSETPDPASIAIETETAGSPWAGHKFVTLRATVRDAGSAVIPSAPVVWTVAPTGSSTLDPPTTVTYPEDGQRLHIAFDSGTTLLVTATVSSTGGDRTATFGVS